MIKSIRVAYILLIITALATIVGCNSRSMDSPDSPAPAPVSGLSQKQKLRVNTAAVEKAIHEHINQERLRHDLPTIRWDDALSRIARKHSKDMATRKYFSHTSPDGHDFSYRYQKSGYACGITVEGVIRTGAENIARIPMNSLSLTDGEGLQQNRYVREKIATSAVREWMTSPDERKNILSPTWQREGIGISIGPDDMIIITLNFC